MAENARPAKTYSVFVTELLHDLSHGVLFVREATEVLLRLIAGVCVYEDAIIDRRLKERVA